MSKKIAVLAAALALCTAAAFAQASTFQNTCSNIAFAYSGSQATLQAVCLTAAGAGNPTSLVLTGISNQNGKLVQSGSGASSFQQSCGNIQITVASGGSPVTLSALCRTSGGSSVASSLPLNGIKNNNGTLSY